MNPEPTRRKFLCASAVVGTGLLLSAYDNETQGQTAEQGKTRSSSEGGESAKGGEVTAVEDLMREHGVLRRALLVYTAAAGKLHSDPATVAPDVLQKTAKLFRTFGED